MNKLKFFSLLLLLTLGCLISVHAQNEISDDAPAAQTKGSGLLQQLNLTQDQIRQIRQINRQDRPQLRAANLRLREANSNLDAAVYGDNADETDVQEKIKAVHAAHAEVVKLRTRIEFSVRKVLLPEQLARFREIRAQSMSEKENSPRLRNNRPSNNQNRPLNNLRRRNR
ncbi:MAG: Spy/CpxP family protein refolding chaperone, partial [Acidobacteriota bacterium]|nr:Spy/CpxP family protein refolding chaperone [Acidobacteriota bacterium]